MRRFFALLFGLALGAGFVLIAGQSLAATDLDGFGPDEAVKRALLRTGQTRTGFATAVDDTVWAGYKASSLDPHKVGFGVGYLNGGRWDFDTGIAGTDSTQYWVFAQNPQASDGTSAYPTPQQRPFWYFNYGNNINIGNHNLWRSRALAGRAFRRTGLAGVWHADDMSTVPLSPGNINGVRSAWCGLRYTGDPNAPVDELTRNRYDNGEQFTDFRGGGAVRSAFPGYANLWDQIMYRDYAYAGSAISMTFRMRLDMADYVAPDPGGSAWFNPDPFSTANFVLNPSDSLMVWVGAPKETGVYDTNRRHLSEVVDFGLAGTGQPQKLVAFTGKIPVAGTDTTVTTSIPAGAGWGGTVRVAFQVKTNRARSDLVTAAGGFNSLDGAAVIDDVNVGGNVSTFEAANSIRPRVLLAANGVETPISPSTSWITTGRPAAWYGHVHNAFDLPYDDPCGGLDGSGARLCNLTGNVIVQSDHDNGHIFHLESQNWAISPTVVLDETSPRGILQGTPANLRTDASKVNFRYEYYSGFDDLFIAGTLFWYAVRYMGHGAVDLEQIEVPKVPNWSPFNTPGIISLWGVPTCITQNTDGDLDGYVPLTQVDSLQIGFENQTRCGRFGATACGDTRGGYWDNIECGFVRGGATAPVINTSFWFLLGDTFPFNEITAPGSVAFDTTTALVKNSLNNAPSAGGEGVVSGDTLVYSSSFAGDDARVDLVFRVWPGPGNYRNRLAGYANPWVLRQNQLLKVPSAGDVAGNYVTAGDGSWWGTYMANNGPLGSASGHTATYWDPQTWNSARMDSCQNNRFPLVDRGLGLAVVDTWMGTLHESDPNYATLGIVRDICFLVDPTGPNDNTNICCSAADCAANFGETWPPAGYDPGAQTSTIEGTKILPDGIFTPGTHIQYFARRSAASNPSVMQSMAPDTTTVTVQNGMGGSFDYQRYDHMDVFPDMWKDTRFGGSGLACILFFDGADRRGYEYNVRGALDTLGYGLDNGSVRGWKRVPANVGDPNDPVGFVPENLGQAGLAYDMYDIRAAESGESDRPGCRLAAGGIPPATQNKQCKQGPTPLMLDTYYNTIIWEGGDLDDANGVLHDGSGVAQEQSDDAGLINAWLGAAQPGNEKALFLMGDGMGEDLGISGTASMNTLANTVGLVFVEDNYFEVSGNQQAGMVFKPLDADPGAADPFHSSRRYGMFNSCTQVIDVIDKDGGVLGAELAGRYEQFSDRSVSGIGAGPFGASVYRRLDSGAGRYYATLVNGFSFGQFRAWNGPGDPTTTKYDLAFNNYAAHAWMEDALNAFNLCARVAPVISVGDQPGLSALNFVRGAFPNPSVAGAATVQFSLAQPAKVTLRFYNVAGRLVHETSVDGVAGLNSYRWDGVTSTGMRAASGVYFYRLSAPGIDFQNNSQRMVLLGQAN